MDQFKPYIEMFILRLKERGLADATRANYVSALTRFFAKTGKDPKLVTIDDVRNYQVSLFDEGLKPKTINLYGAAIRSFFLDTLNTGWPENFLARAKERRTLPVLLSPGEVADLINATPDTKSRTLLMTMYGAGLRPIEVVSLKPENVDSRRMVLHVEIAKGGKNRLLPLSDLLLEALRFYWFSSSENKWLWLFPDTRDHQKPFQQAKINTILKSAAQSAGLEKSVTARVIRHCFATHLLELGVDLRKIQLLLGHAVISSTEIYTHLRSEHVPEIKNPLDTIADRVRIGRR